MIIEYAIIGWLRATTNRTVPLGLLSFTGLIHGFGIRKIGSFLTELFEIVHLILDLLTSSSLKCLLGSNFMVSRRRVWLLSRSWSRHSSHAKEIDASLLSANQVRTSETQEPQFHSRYVFLQFG